MLSPAMIALLRCPNTKQPLRLATAAEKSAHGIPADEEALAAEDGSRLYRTVNEMPVLLPSAEVVATG
jgi:uncharacterized protein YbaR (Trm112 family)